jgi:hypothetical protein
MGILDDAIREHLELKRAHGANDDEIRRKEAEAFGPVRHDAGPLAADEHTQLLAPDDAAALAEPGDAAPAGIDALAPAPDDPYAVHPGDEPVLDSHDHGHAEGSDPAWGQDTELFAGPAADETPPPAAEAGAGMLDPSTVETGPPTPPDHHHDEQHPALRDRDHVRGEEHPPEPVFRRTAEAPTAPPDAPLEPAPVDDPPVGDPPVQNPDIDEPPPRQSAEPAGDDEDVLEETPEFLQDAPEHDRLWFEQKPPRDFDFGE